MKKSIIALSVVLCALGLLAIPGCEKTAPASSDVEVFNKESLAGLDTYEVKAYPGDGLTVDLDSPETLTIYIGEKNKVSTFFVFEEPNHLDYVCENPFFEWTCADNTSVRRYRYTVYFGGKDYYFTKFGI